MENRLLLAVGLFSACIFLAALTGEPDQTPEERLRKDMIRKHEEEIYRRILEHISLPCSVKYPNSTLSINRLCLPEIPASWKIKTWSLE